MHLTDQSLPPIIEKAFQGKSKKRNGLMLRDNSITSFGVRILVEQLLSMKVKLKYLSLSNNIEVKDSGIEHLCHLIQENQSIAFLSIGNTGITNRSVQLLANSLKDHGKGSYLEKIYLCHNREITDDALDSLIKIVEQNEKLKFFSLEYCNLSEQTLKIFKQSISKKQRKILTIIE